MWLRDTHFGGGLNSNKKNEKILAFYSGIRYTSKSSRKTHAGVSEWQTRKTQNLLRATACGFKSRCRQFNIG